LEWRDEGLIIGTRTHGETSVIVEAMTRAHGRHFGLVQGGRSRRMRPFLQPGTEAELVWRARLEEHLGTFSIEPVRLRMASLLANAEALHALSLAAALLRLAAEREPHPQLYEMALRITSGIDTPEILPPLLVQFEAAILAQMGFGLDLTRCAATGAAHELIYVSPRSGRAVSKAAGEPYKTRLLPLPAFLHGEAPVQDPSFADIMNGFRLTGFFLARDIYGPRGKALPLARESYLAELDRRFAIDRSKGPA
jgi:DNA repair protein RecO (recombination protein O)